MLPKVSKTDLPPSNVRIETPKMPLSFLPPGPLAVKAFSFLISSPSSASLPASSIRLPKPLKSPPKDNLLRPKSSSTGSSSRVLLDSFSFFSCVAMELAPLYTVQVLVAACPDEILDNGKHFLPLLFASLRTTGLTRQHVEADFTKDRIVCGSVGPTDLQDF